MQYYALFFGTSIQDDIYAQVTGFEIDAEIEETDLILSGEKVPFDCYLDIDVAELEEWLAPTYFSSSLPSTPSKQS